LWTGQKHSGKTTSAAKLINVAHKEGFNIAGLLAPSIYQDGKLLGFDILDLRNKTRVPLTRRKSGQFIFFDEGLEFGRVVLSEAATEYVNLIIVDEFGPLELNGQGWRKNIDSLIASSNALILLVVRRELAESVCQLYADLTSIKLNAAEPKSIDKVTEMLRNHRQSQREIK